MPAPGEGNLAAAAECGLACEKPQMARILREEACPAADEAAESARMKAEEAVGPTPSRNAKPDAPRTSRSRTPRPRRTPRPARASGARGDRLRQPEGRCRQDDDRPQPRGCLQGVWPRRARGGHGPSGQPDDEPGRRPRQGREEHVRRARAPDSAARGHRRARDRRRCRLDRPCRRRDRDERDRARAFPAEGDRRGARRLRLHLHRHTAQPGAAHGQRAHRCRQGHRRRCSASTSRCAAWCSCRTRCR